MSWFKGFVIGFVVWFLGVVVYLFRILYLNYFIGSLKPDILPLYYVLDYWYLILGLGVVLIGLGALVGYLVGKYWVK